jgi:cytoskeleton protein RodZ
LTAVLRKRSAKTKAGSGQRGRGRVLNLGGGEPVVEAVEAAPQGPVDPLYQHDTIGEALKAIRLDKGLTLAELADSTRVRRAYLEALEEMRLEALPSRPFTIGYIRAYALALGVDPDLATERFKSDEPVLDEPLRAPVGVPDEKDPRVAAFLVGALLIIAAIVLWNVAQRAMIAGAPPPAMASHEVADKALAELKTGPMELGAPLPAPVESTTPTPYETPGLAVAMGMKPADPNTPEGGHRPKAVGEAPPPDLATLPRTFAPAGRVYDAGNPRLNSPVIIQALKPAALIVRGTDGSIYFARQLAKGEAYRIPTVAGLTLDVSSQYDFQVFVQGQTKGFLPAQQVLASKLVTATPTTPAAASVAAQPPQKLNLPPAAPTVMTPVPAPKTTPARPPVN